MKNLPLLLSAAILSFTLPINMVLAQTSVTIPTQVIPPPVADTRSFGRTVEVDGTRAIVEESNGVYIYEFSNNRWDLTADLFLSLPDRSRTSTGSVALDDSTAAVQYGTNNGTNSSAFLGVFELSNDEWTQTAAIELPFSARASNFTNPLAVSGETIVIGVSDFDGKAHIYEKIDNVWTLINEINSPDVESDLPPVFARNLDVYDDTIVISQTSIFNSSTNQALFIYKRIDGNWFQESRLPIVAELTSGAHKTVSLSANRLIVAVRDGAVVFDLVNGNWIETGFFGPSNLAIAPNGQFTLNERITTVSLNSTGSQVALGSSEGRVILFQFVNGEWIESELGTNNIPLQFGVSVGIDGEHLMAGSLGAVYYYRLNQTSPCIDADGDGFGWNGTNTCTPTTTTITVDNSPQLQQCIDSDGDGFGWNGVATCDPAENTMSVVDDQPQVAQCIDSDGDGFGWNGVETCIPDGSELQPVIDQSLVCIDSDGDGWGWTGTQSCRFDEQGNIVIL